MRHGLLLAAALVALAVPTNAADLPPVVIQLAAPGKLLDDVRGMAKAVGGEKLVAQFNDSLKAKFGDKGLSGLDLSRPPVFGVYFRENAAPDKTAYIVGIAPYTDEKDFLALIQKDNATIKPVDGKKGRYILSAANDKTSYLQFHEGFVHAGFDMSEAEFENAKFPSYDKLVTPGETAIVSARVFIERLPASVQKTLGETLDQAMASVANMPFPPDAKEGVKKTAEKFGAAAKTYLEQAKQMQEGIVRVVFDPNSAEAAIEIGVIGAPGSSLAADIAGRAVTKNRFATLLGKETAGGAILGFPLTNPNIREGLALAFEAGGKEGLSAAPPPAAATLDELVKGIARTLRSGELDFGASLNGPNKNSQFAVLVGVSFDNPAALEKELRTLYKNAPPEVKTLLKLDAAKVGEQSVHIARLGPALPPEVQRIFGDEAELAFTFAPKGIYVVFGTDPLMPLKAALESSPQPSRALDVVMNPSRLEKLITVGSSPQAAAKVAELFGNDDKLLSAVFASIEGGKDLKIRIGMNLKVLPRVAMLGAAVPSQP